MSKTIKMRRGLVLMCLVLLIGLMGVMSVSATNYFNLCLTDGEVVHFSYCNPGMSNFYCNADVCNICVYYGSRGYYCHAESGLCNAIGGTCNYLGDGNGDPPVIDQTLPNITSLTLLEDGGVYSDKKQYVRATVDKVSDWYVKNYAKRNCDWDRLCKDTTTCYEDIKFQEGENRIIIKAIANSNGLSDEKELVITIDSKDPRVKKTYPKKGFANGVFEVEFKEMNPKSLILYYGGKERIVNLSTECRLGTKKKVYSFTKAKGRHFCSVDVGRENIEDLDGKRIYYWFTLTDVANTVDSSKRRSLQVDISPPDITNNPFYTIDGEKVYFNIAITEKNLDEVTYSYWYKGRLKEKRLCSKLKNGKCEKKVKFKEGHHIVDIHVLDEAGNAIAERIEFDTWDE